MRRLFPLLAVLFVVPLFGSDSPKEYDDRTESVGIEGTWRWTEIEDAGGRRKTGGEDVYTFRNGTFTIDNGNGEPGRGTYRIDLTCKPPHLDLVFSKAQTFQYIYRIDGDTLWIACSPADFSRPKGFDGKGVFIQTCKRVK